MQRLHKQIRNPKALLPIPMIFLQNQRKKSKQKKIFQQNHQCPYPNHPMDLLEWSGKKEEIINISSYPALLKTSMKIKSIRILWKEMLRRIT